MGESVLLGYSFCVPVVCQLTQISLYSTERKLRDYEELLRSPQRYERTQTTKNRYLRLLISGSQVRALLGSPFLFNDLGHVKKAYNLYAVALWWHNFP